MTPGQVAMTQALAWIKDFLEHVGNLIVFAITWPF